jgi:hypothetical protein
VRRLAIRRRWAGVSWSRSSVCAESRGCRGGFAEVEAHMERGGEGTKMVYTIDLIDSRDRLRLT